MTLFAFTDPVCEWCWASEALFRALETHYPETLEIRHVAGGMVRDIREFEDFGAGLSGHQTFAEANAGLAKAYLETAKTHHMPAMTEGFRLFSEATPSSWPQNIAFKAAQIASPQHANRFLRRIRQATMAEAKPTGEAAVLYDLARECGIDLKKYAKALTDGSAVAAFKQDLKSGAEHDVDLFPTFILSFQEKAARLMGFVSFKEFEETVTELSGGAIRAQASPPRDEALLKLLGQYLYLSREEIRQAFDLEKGQTPEAWCERLEKEGKLRLIPLGQSWVARTV